MAVAAATSTDGAAGDAAEVFVDTTVYDLVDLGALPNDSYAEARAISEDGKVAVVCKSTGTSMDGLAAVWASGTLTGIGMPAGRPIVIPNGINAAGVVAGTTNLTTLSMPPISFPSSR